MFNLFGGHIALGAILSLIVVCIFHRTHHSLIASILLYFVLCFGFWIIGDWIFGVKELPSTNELHRF